MQMIGSGRRTAGRWALHGARLLLLAAAAAFGREVPLGHVARELADGLGRVG